MVQNVTYISLACITNIIVGGDQAWYYTSCSKCSSKTHLASKKHICLDHGEVHEPTYRYRFVAEISDECYTTKVVFFDQVATSMLDTSCYDMMITRSNPDCFKLLATINELKGKPYLFELQQKDGGYDLSITVANVFQTPSKKGSASSYTEPSSAAASPQTPLTKIPKRHRDPDSESPGSRQKAKED